MSDEMTAEEDDEFDILWKQYIALEAERDRLKAEVAVLTEAKRQLEEERERLQAVFDAASDFRDNGTTLTACNRGPCQQVIEYEDKSDPQARLFAALERAALTGTAPAKEEG